MKLVLAAVVLCVLVYPIWTRYIYASEFTKVMVANGVKSDFRIRMWRCITNMESGYNTTTWNKRLGRHGLFQIDQKEWCYPPGTGCNMTCASMRDRDINNDVKCAKLIFAKEQKASGNGFNAWPAYKRTCKAKIKA